METQTEQEFQNVDKNTYSLDELVEEAREASAKRNAEVLEAIKQEVGN